MKRNGAKRAEDLPGFFAERYLEANEAYAVVLSVNLMTACRLTDCLLFLRKLEIERHFSQ